MRYRLFDIDVVISKAVLYGSLAVFIAAVYAGLVVGIGTLAGNQRSPLLAAAAVRWWRLPSSPPGSGPGGSPTGWCTAGGLPRTRCCPTSPAGSVAPTPTRRCCHRWRRSWQPETGAEQVVVWLRIDDELRPEVSSDGSRHAGPLPVDGHELPPLPDIDLSVPVVHQGHLLGAISVKMPKDGAAAPSRAATGRRRRLAGRAGAGQRRSDRGPAGVPATAGGRAG